MRNIEIKLTPNLRYSKVCIDGKEIKGVCSVTIIGDVDDGQPELIIEGYRTRADGKPILLVDEQGELLKFRHRLTGGHIKISAQFE